VRGVALLLSSFTHPLVAMYQAAPGWRVLLIGRALLGRRRKLVVLQLISHPARRRRGRLRARVERWAIRRTMVRGQALDRSSLDFLPGYYDLAPERFAYVPWFLLRRPVAELPPRPDAPLVLSGGRSYCDWDTLFAAAAGEDWPLEVVCSAADRPRVEELARPVGARVHCELEREDYDALVRRASVIAVIMREQGIPQGHVRIMDATTQGIPLVVTATASVRDYVRDGTTALTVPPGAVADVRAAVNRLLADEDLAQRLRSQALERAAGWDIDRYLESLGDLVAGRPVELPPAAP
jgi:glycosyltransferase involved in cell wall biosynthesis